MLCREGGDQWSHVLPPWEQSDWNKQGKISHKVTWQRALQFPWRADRVILSAQVQQRAAPQVPGVDLSAVTQQVSDQQVMVGGSCYLQSRLHKAPTAHRGKGLEGEDAAEAQVGVCVWSVPARCVLSGPGSHIRPFWSQEHKPGPVCLVPRRCEDTWADGKTTAGDVYVAFSCFKRLFLRTCLRLCPGGSAVWEKFLRAAASLALFASEIKSLWHQPPEALAVVVVVVVVVGQQKHVLEQKHWGYLAAPEVPADENSCQWENLLVWHIPPEAPGGKNVTAVCGVCFK